MSWQFIKIFAIGLWLLFFVPAAQAFDVKGIVQQAQESCEGTTKKLKDGLYIEQAYLREKESCVIKQFAGQLIEAEDQNIQDGAYRVIRECVRASQNASGITLDKFDLCMKQAVAQVAQRISAPCEEIPKYISTGLGKDYCSETVLFLLAQKFKEMISPKPSVALRVYVWLVEALWPSLPITPALAIAFYLFYLAAIFWQGDARWWQVGIVSVLLVVLLVLRLMGVLLAPVLAIAITAGVLIFNQLPKKTEPDLGLSPAEILKRKNDNHKQS